MTMTHALPSTAAPPALPVGADLLLESFSYEPRPRLTAALERELARAGCWVLERRATSPTGAELSFELLLSGVEELYAGLLAAGLELTRAGHGDITALCTLWRFCGAGGNRLVTVQLGISFLDEITVASVLSTGTAFA